MPGISAIGRLRQDYEFKASPPHILGLSLKQSNKQNHNKSHCCSVEVREKEGLRDRKIAEKVLKEKLRRPRWGIRNTMTHPGEMGPLGAEMRGKDNSQAWSLCY